MNTFTIEKQKLEVDKVHFEKPFFFKDKANNVYCRATGENEQLMVADFDGYFSIRFSVDAFHPQLDLFEKYPAGYEIIEPDEFNSKVAEVVNKVISLL